MLEHFTPEDNEYDDNDYHKQVRAQTQQPANTKTTETLLKKKLGTLLKAWRIRNRQKKTVSLKTFINKPSKSSQNT